MNHPTIKPSNHPNYKNHIFLLLLVFVLPHCGGKSKTEEFYCPSTGVFEEGLLDGWVSQGEASPGVSWSEADLKVLLEADELIDNIRKKEVTLFFEDQQSNPIPGACVEVEQASRAFPLGSAIALNFSDPPDEELYCSTFIEWFNLATFENILKWHELEPDEGDHRWEPVDRTLDWLEAQGIAVRGHNLLWGGDDWIPSWIEGFSQDEVRVRVEEHIKEVVGRYKDRIQIWDVVNEPIHARGYETIFGNDYIEKAFNWARSADPDGILVLNEYFVDRFSSSEEIREFKDIVASLLAEGVPIDAIGLQCHFIFPQPFSEIRGFFDDMAGLGLPIHITEFDALITEDEEEMADFYEGFYRTAFAHPSVENITMWGFYEGRHWRPEGAIFDSDFNPKRSAEALSSLFFDRWMTRGTGMTTQEGTLTFRGFHGSYGYKISIGDKIYSEGEFSLDSEGESELIIRIQ